MFDVLLDDISGYWSDYGKNAKKLIILSPYITMPLEKEILDSVSDIEVYTLFNAKDFFIGSSDLDVLIDMKKAGVKIFALRDLHAKIVFSPNQFFSIGSQNFTKNGKRKKEASIFSTDKTKLKELESSFEEWVEEAEELDKAAFESVKEKIAKYADKYPNIKEFFREPDSQHLNSNKYSKSKVIKKSLASTKVNKEGLMCKVQYSVKTDTWHDYMSLKPAKNNRNIDDLFQSSGIDLLPQNRYLIIYDNFKIGWARVNKTRITYYNDEVLFTDEFAAQDKSYQLRAISKSYKRKGVDTNLLIELLEDGKARALLKCYCDFKVDSLSIERVVEGFKTLQSEMLLNYVEENKVSIESNFHKLIITPFKYQDRLIGVEADEFFESNGVINLNLHNVRGELVLSAESQ